MTDSLEKDAGVVRNQSNDYSVEKVEREEIEQIPVTPTGSGFGYRARRHCARRWWIHLIIFCVIFLIVALCLVYVAMPKIAQAGVNESSIEFTGIEFLNPTSNSVVLTQYATLHSPSMYTPTLDSFTAALYYVANGTQFGPAPMTYVQMPSIHALHPESNNSVIGQEVQITDLDQLTDYATALLVSENVTTALVGKTKLHEGKLPVLEINYNSSSTYKGLNGLAGFNVTDVKLNLSATAGSPNLFGTAFIPNPSVITVMMGNVTLTLSTASQGVVGNATIENMTLVPGNNNLPMASIIEPAKLLAAKDAATGMVMMMIAGQYAVFNGQHLTYYEKALASNVLTLPMNLTQILADNGL